MRYEDFQTALRRAVAALDTNPYRAAISAGLPGTAIRHALEGHEPKVIRAAEIAHALGLEFYIGPPRDGSTESSARPSPPSPSPAIPPDITDLLGLPPETDAETVVAALRKMLADKGAAVASSVATLDKQTLERTLDSKFKSETRSMRSETRALASKLDALAERLSPPDISVPNGRRLSLRQIGDVRAAGGLGEEIFEEGDTGTLIVAADDIPQGLDPDRLVGIRAEGRSMEPTIHTDDILVLNLDATEPREGAIFVVRTDTGLVVKRLSKDAEAWTLTSDADDWEPRPVTEGDRIIGHVVWFGPEGAVVLEEQKT